MTVDEANAVLAELNYTPGKSSTRDLPRDQARRVKEACAAIEDAKRPERKRARPNRSA